jgi:hypothetical protein
VEVTGVMLALLDMPAWCTEEYNRWYDLDHMPEHVSKRDVLMGRRYVATKALRDVDGVQPSEWLGGYPPYLTNYWFGGPLDFDGEEAIAGWLAKDRVIVKGGRYWQLGRSAHASRWHVADAQARPGVLVDKAAVPYLAHRGVIVALGRAPAPERVNETVAWWDTVHLVDLFTVPGLLAAVRFSPTDSSHDGLVFHLLLCEEAPEDVMAGIQRAKRAWEATGRFPAYGGIYEEMAFLPYQRIVPLEYGFEI